jgi:acetoin utilization deacetylase AcuC-like enzyme
VSDLDIPLPDNTTDDEYLEILTKNLKKITEFFKPEFLHYQAGVEVLSTDKLGRLALSIAGCRQRDIEVLTVAKKHGIPVVVTMGGGYSLDIQVILEAHCNTYV